MRGHEISRKKIKCSDFNFEYTKMTRIVQRSKCLSQLGTFLQNSKPKGANFDILHFLSFGQIFGAAFRGLEPIEFDHSLHQTLCLYILWCEKNTRFKLNGEILPNLHFLKSNYTKCLNFSKLRLAPLCRRITLREHRKYALRITMALQTVQRPKAESIE